MSGRPNQPNPRQGLSPTEAAGLIVIAFALIITAIVTIGSIALFGARPTALALGSFAAGFIVRGVFR